MNADQRTAATRQNLLAGARRLAQVGRGTALLRRKREALVGELFRAARPAVELRRAIAERAATAWPALLEALTTSGHAGLQPLGWPAREVEVEMRAGQVWGIPVSEILRRSPVRRTLAARGVPMGVAPSSAVRAAAAFEDLTDTLLEAAGREALLRRLGEAVARTSRQVNTLEHRLAPALRETIDSIRSTLDEREREEHLRLTRRRAALARPRAIS